MTASTACSDAVGCEANSRTRVRAHLCSARRADCAPCRRNTFPWSPRGGGRRRRPPRGRPGLSPWLQTTSGGGQSWDRNTFLRHAEHGANLPRVLLVRCAGSSQERIWRSPGHDRMRHGDRRDARGRACNGHPVHRRSKAQIQPVRNSRRVDWSDGNVRGFGKVRKHVQRIRPCSTQESGGPAC